MKKTVLVLLDDYWHRRETIEPALPLLFPQDMWDVEVAQDPDALPARNPSPDLFVSFKDVIENDQIPTPIWCDDAWTAVLDRYIREEGMGFLAIHCGIADIPRDDLITTQILRAFFLGHPRPCPVTVTPVPGHPITEGVEEFLIPMDEHYQMEMMPDAETTVLGYTTSENGRQPGVWVHEYGKGRVCAATPGHAREQLQIPAYVRLLKNAAAWCAR